MRFRTTLLTAVAGGAFLFVTACGGGDNASVPTSQSQQSPPVDSGGNGSGSSAAGSSTTGSSAAENSVAGAADSNAGSGGINSNCQIPAQTSIVGGALFVAEQGQIGATLLTNHGFEVLLGYSTCDNNCNAPQRQDAFAMASPGTRPFLFERQTVVGTTVELKPQVGIPIGGQMVSTFPKGTPIFVVFLNGDEFSATANNKDMGRAYPKTALVTYGAGNTATVDFHTSTGFDIRVALTNVRRDLASACPT